MIYVSLDGGCILGVYSDDPKLIGHQIVFADSDNGGGEPENIHHILGEPRYIIPDEVVEINPDVVVDVNKALKKMTA